MGAARKLETKKRKRYPQYWTIKDHKASAGNAKIAQEFCETFVTKETKKYIRFWTDPIMIGGEPVRPYMKPSIAILGFKRDHSDIKGFMYANPIDVKSFRNKNTGFREQVVFQIGDAYNGVIDIDNHPTAISIEGLLSLLKQLPIPLPLAITQTSPRNFHLLYAGNRTSLNQKRFETICARIAGVDPKEDMTEIEFLRLLKKGGIDVGYMRTERKSHKIRIPGTVNDKRGPMFVCKGWINKEYLSKPEDFIEALGEPSIFYKETTKSILVQEKKHNEFWRRNIPKLEMILDRHYSKKKASQFAEVLAKRMGWLRNGVCYISQENLADEIGKGQQYVSKVLNEMRSLGIIKMTKEYYRDPEIKSRNRPRCYGAGDVIEAAFAKRHDDLPKPRINLTIPYAKEETYLQMLDDIRRAYGAGADEASIVDFCLKKQELCRPRRNHRSERDIRRIVDNWVSKFHSPSNPGFYRPPSCLVDLKEALGAIEEGIQC